MDLGVFAIVYVAGAAAIALWVDQRFPALGPARLGAVFLNLLASMALAQLAVPLLLPEIARAGGVYALLAAIMTVVLVVLVYSLLASIWLIKIAVGAAGGRLR